YGWTARTPSRKERALLDGVNRPVIIPVQPRDGRPARRTRQRVAMPNPHLSILVVDDAKFSSAIIGRALTNAGYQDGRFASSAAEALRQLEIRPAGVLLADWLMPEMDGLELTAQVRLLDESADHYTYIILLTGKEGDNVLAEAFDRG